MYDILKLWVLRLTSFFPVFIHGLSWKAGWMVFDVNTFPEDLDFDVRSSSIILPHESHDEYDSFKKRFGIFGPRDLDKSWHLDGIVPSECGPDYLLISLVIHDPRRLGREVPTVQFIRPLTKQDILVVNTFIGKERFRITKKLRERVLRGFDRKNASDSRE